MQFIKLAPSTGAETVVGEGSLKELYDWIGCDCVEVTQRRIGDGIYNIVCDEEGLLKANPQCTAVSSKNLRPLLFGTLVIGKEDPEFIKCAVGLEYDDIVNIANEIKKVEYSDEDGKSISSSLLFCS